MVIGILRETAKQLGDNARFEAELMVMSVMEMDRTRLVFKRQIASNVSTYLQNE